MEAIVQVYITGTEVDVLLPKPPCSFNRHQIS
jgi:hypothetical protein